jgi:hypothetical protein
MPAKEEQTVLKTETTCESRMNLLLGCEHEIPWFCMFKRWMRAADGKGSSVVLRKTERFSHWWDLSSGIIRHVRARPRHRSSFNFILTIHPHCWVTQILSEAEAMIEKFSDRIEAKFPSRNCLWFLWATRPPSSCPALQGSHETSVPSNVQLDTPRALDLEVSPSCGLIGASRT